MMRFLLCAAVIVAAWGTVLAPLPAADWPGFRNQGRTGVSTESGLQQSWETTKPRLLWMAEGMGGGYASVAVADGRVFTTGNFTDGQGVVAVSAQDGRQLWRTTVTDAVPEHSYEGSRSTPTVDGDYLYVVTSDGQIACLRTADGRIEWKRDFKKDWNGRMMSGWGYSESPLVDGRLVLCTPGGPDAMVVALDKRTGREV